MAKPQRSVLKEIELLVRAKYPLIYIVSHEEKRVLQDINNMMSTPTFSTDTQKNLVYIWSQSEGLRRLLDDGEKLVSEETTDPLLAIDYIFESKISGVFVFLDFHHFISPSRGDSSRFVRKIRDVAKKFPTSRYLKSFILLSPVLEIPLELEKDIAVVDFPLPDLDDLGAMLNEIVENVGCGLSVELSDNGREEILRAALGLSFVEAENVFSKALIDDGKLNDDDVVTILKEKEQIIKKAGMLEYISPDSSHKIGGLENLKGWFKERSAGFTQRAREFNLPEPRGVLLIGVPGCGKSLCARVLASQWKKPLLRFDVGRAFGKYLGESESNMRKAIKTAETLAPCILWIDEIEKEFAGHSGNLDSGASARIFASFLTWMQEKDKPVFVLATANNIKQLPPEFLRKGRFDEIFFVDLPTQKERKEIFKIHLTIRCGHFKGIDIDCLAAQSEGYSGAEIAESIISSLYRVFSDNRQLSTEDILLALKDTVPLSAMMYEQIQTMRSWSEQRARRASCMESTEMDGQLVE